MAAASVLFSQWLPAEMSGSSSQPKAHDALVRYTFSRPEAMAIELRHVLDPALHRFIDFDSLAPLPTADLSGSVLNDPLARPGPLALVELTRALLYAYENPSSLTPTRLETLAPLFDQVMDQRYPLGIKDIHALCTYVTKVFKPDSPLGELITESVSKEGREMYRTIADELREEGLNAGLELGRAEGRAESLLDVLRFRAVPISDEQRRRVLLTDNERVLRRWLARAFTITSADELFDPA